MNMADDCKCPACNPMNHPNFEYVASRKLTLKERIHKQRMENFDASDRAFEYVQANQGRYAEHRASILAERKMAKKGYLDAIGESVTDAAHYVGGITKAVGDTVTSSVESVLKNPSVIVDTVNNVASTIVDGVTYFPDVILDEVAPDLSYGAKDRTNKRIDSALAGISEGLDQLGDDITKHNQAFSSGDFESAGAVVGGYVSSVVLPSKKIKALGGSSFKKASFKAPSGTNYEIYQQKIDWNLKVNTRNGDKTNLDLALDSRSPFIIKDDKYTQVNLHHSKQNANGPLFELTAKTHQKYYGNNALHPYLPKKHPLYPVDRGNFDIDREAYWIERANNELKER